MDPIISIRISHQRGVDAVLTDARCDVIDEFSQDCYAPGVVMPFISKYAEQHPNLVVVISPSDPWPPHLQRAVEELGLPISWVARPFEREACEGAAPWRRQRRQYRARFLAHLYYRQHQRLCDCGFESGVDWEHHLAHQTLEAIEAHRSKMYEF
jgi:hypothetical protein